MSTWRSIVCGVNGVHACKEAVRVAARLAREQSAKLVLVHVEKLHATDGLLQSAAARLTAARDEHTLRWTGFASAVRGEPVPLELIQGDPADALLDYAVRTGCDLIVLGSRSQHRASLALTSIVGKVVARAPCPVIVVPAALEDLRPDFPNQVA